MEVKQQQQQQPEDEADTLAPIQQAPHQQQQQHQTGAGRSLMAGIARRGTVAPGAGPGGGSGGMLGAGGPRKSIAAAMLGRAALASLGNLARRSKAQDVRLENTYRTGPKDEERLRSWKLNPMVADALQEIFAGYAYSSVTAGRKACDAALAVRNRVREAGYERYKVVVFVAVVENRPQGGNHPGGLSLASRALWCPGGECADNFTEAAYVTGSTRVHATVHAFYYE